MAQWVLAIIGLVIAILVAGVVYVVYLDGPDLEVTRAASGIRVSATFLGEYSLGLERLVLEDLTLQRTVLEAVSSGRPFADVIDLAPGSNRAAEVLGPFANVLVPATGLVMLVPAHDYRLTVWGNNGFARIRPSSCRFRM